MGDGRYYTDEQEHDDENPKRGMKKSMSRSSGSRKGWGARTKMRSGTERGTVARDHPVRHRQWRNYYRHEAGDDDGFAACQQHHIQYGATYDRSDQHGAKKVVLNARMSLDGGDPSFSRFIKRNGKTAPGHSLLARFIKRKLKTEQARTLLSRDILDQSVHVRYRIYI